MFPCKMCHESFSILKRLQATTDLGKPAGISYTSNKSFPPACSRSTLAQPHQFHSAVINEVTYLLFSAIPLCCCSNLIKCFLPSTINLPLVDVEIEQISGPIKMVVFRSEFLLQ